MVFKFKKGGLVESKLGRILIALVVLAMVLFGISIITGKGLSGLDFINRLFRFGR